MELTRPEMFMWGFMGSTALEVLAAFRFYQNEEGLPVRYKSYGFYLVRFTLAIFGGMLCIAHEVPTELMAVHIGAATPLILGAFGTTLPPGLAGGAGAD